MAIARDAVGHFIDDPDEPRTGSYDELVRRRELTRPDADGCIDLSDRGLCPPIAHAVGDATGAPVRVRVSARRRKPAWRE